MVTKKYFLLLLPTLLLAQKYTFKIEEQRYETYTTTKQRSLESTFVKDDNYYSSKNEILVSFYKKIDLKAFAKQHNLKIVQKVSKVRENYLMQPLSHLGTTCETIGKDKRVRYAIPNWHIDKSLY